MIWRVKTSNRINSQADFQTISNLPSKLTSDPWQNPYKTIPKNQVPLTMNFQDLIQSSKGLFFMYLNVIIRLEIPFPLSSSHIFFSLSKIPNHSKFFISHPPHSIGVDIASQLAIWYFWCPSMLPHRKEKIAFLNKFRIDLGHLARAN